MNCILMHTRSGKTSIAECRGGDPYISIRQGMTGTVKEWCD